MSWPWRGAGGLWALLGLSLHGVPVLCRPEKPYTFPAWMFIPALLLPHSQQQGRPCPGQARSLLLVSKATITARLCRHVSGGKKKSILQPNYSVFFPDLDSRKSCNGVCAYIHLCCLSIFRRPWHLCATGSSRCSETEVKVNLLKRGIISYKANQNEVFRHVGK